MPHISTSQDLNAKAYPIRTFIVLLGPILSRLPVLLLPHTDVPLSQVFQSSLRLCKALYYQATEIYKEKIVYKIK